MRSERTACMMFGAEEGANGGLAVAIEAQGGKGEMGGDEAGLDMEEPVEEEVEELVDAEASGHLPPRRSSPLTPGRRFLHKLAAIVTPSRVMESPRHGNGPPKTR